MASYAFRNKNVYQLACLRRTTLPSFLRYICEVWRSCVEKNPALAKYLKTSLSAANPSMLQIDATSVTEATRRGKQQRFHQLRHLHSRRGRKRDECLDPAIADAEALECECMEWMQAQCGEDEDCFKSKYCEHDEVCEHWKVANGCPQSLLTSEMNKQ